MEDNKYTNNELNKNLNNKSNKKSKKKLGIIFAGLTTIVISAGGFYLYKSNELIKSYEDKVYPNIYINNTDISGFTKTEVASLLKEEIKDFDNRKIVINIDDYNVDKTLSEFNPLYNFGGYDTEELLINSVINYGKDKNFWEKLNLLRKSSKKEYKITYDYEHNLVDVLGENIYDDIYVKKVEPTLSMYSYGNFSVTEGRDGYYINKEELIEKLNSELEKVSKEDIVINMEKIIDKRSKDTNLLKSVNKKISSYSSKYSTGNSRASNIELATRKIDNLVLMPGEEFSYEKAVSPVTKANGYKDGGVYVNGRVQQGIGGGICQVSSTLYNAQLKAGIVATKRRNHSMPVGYVPLGQDATMSTGYLDLKFKNTYDFPIFINAYCSNGTLTTEIWSNENATKGIDYEVYTKVYGNGLKADTYLYGYKDGVKVVDKFLHTSTYKALN